MSDYTPREMMAIAAAREIRDGEVVFCGTGISMLAAMAAKTIHAPNCLIFFETGAIDSALQELPLAVADPRVMFGTAVNGSLADAFAFMQNRHRRHPIVGILGAAQIDKYGNLNSTVIGDYHHPHIRFAGSGGASDVASFVERTIIFMQQDPRKFVETLDYLTSPGWLDGMDTRAREGLSAGGPAVVVTDMATMGFDENSREMVLRGYFRGFTPRQVLAKMSFSIDTGQARELPPPSARELRVLREDCDPHRLILD